MEFVIDYESNVIKNRNLFYFNNYCNNYCEFEEWLKHNEVCRAEFEGLNYELKEIYIEHIQNYIIDTFRSVQKNMRTVSEEEKIRRLKLVYDIYMKYFYLMHKWMENDKIITIYNFYQRNKYEIMRRIGVID